MLSYFCCFDVCFFAFVVVGVICGISGLKFIMTTAVVGAVVVVVVVLMYILFLLFFFFFLFIYQ